MENKTGLYAYNNFIWEISKAFDEVLEESAPSNRMYEIGLAMVDYIDSK